MIVNHAPEVAAPAVERKSGSGVCEDMSMVIDDVREVEVWSPAHQSVASPQKNPPDRQLEQVAQHSK